MIRGKNKLKYLLAALFISIQVVACDINHKPGKAMPDASNTNVTTVQKGKSIQWYLNFSSWKLEKEWKEYSVLKEVSDITGVEPIIKTPSINEDEKMDLMIATNDLPDMLTLDLSDYYAKKLIKQNLVYSLDELIEKYDVRFKDEINKELWTNNRYEDGKLYGLPSYFIPKSQYNKKSGIGTLSYNVRKDIYLSLGSPNMGTPDNFIMALKAFKSKYTEINGKKAVPVCLYGYEDNQVEVIERSFGIGNYAEDKEHNLQIKYKDPKYIDALIFMNKLYREGLMDPLAFIKQYEQLDEDICEGRVFAVPLKFSSLTKANITLDKVKPDSHYIAIEPLKAVPEVAFPGEVRLGRTITMVSKNTKTPESIIKFMRYLWSKEGNLLLNFGHEGVNYERNGENISVINKPNTDKSHNTNFDTNKTGVGKVTFFYYPYFNIKDNSSKDDKDIRTMLDKYVYDNTAYTYDIEPEPGQSIGLINSKINNIIKNFYPKVIMAPSQNYMTAYYDYMLREMEKAGLKQLEVYWSQNYKRNLRKFR